jgi:hypothetical protein
MKRLVIATAVLACGFAAAKLPAPQLDDAAKAKAAEAAAKTAWQAKVDAYKLCQAQDRIAAAYRKGAGKAASAPAKETKAAASAAAKAASPSAKASAAAAAPAQAAASSTPTPSPAVAAAPTVPPCADPGPFAYNAPEQKPLETSGAHSPAGNATSPPSVGKTSAEMKPAEKKKP